MNLKELNIVPEKIEKATLSVFRKGLLFDGAEYFLNDDCLFKLYQVDQPWTEDAHEWNIYNNIYTEPVLDYKRYTFGDSPSWYNFDVTKTIKTYLKHPEKNHGFMLLNELEDGLSNVSKFASSEYSDLSKRPKLIIKTSSNAINDHNTSNNMKISILSSNSSHIKFKANVVGEAAIKIYSLNGALVHNSSRHLSGKGVNQISLNKNLSTGLYFIKIKIPEKVFISKLMITK